MVAGDVVLRGPGLIEFAFLYQRTGSKVGGRELFEQLIQDLVGIEHPDVATVEANPGDWGIDAFIGQLVAGTVAVWQAKYFIDGFGATQQAEVRDSYRSAKKAAAEHGYTLQAWTLCIPVALDGPNSQWWERWKKKQEREDNVVIDVWHKVSLRRRLLRQEAQHLREYYFNPIVCIPKSAENDTEPTVTELTDPSKYDGALFVKQMQEAGLPDCRSAREEFFNAEILTQEIHDKGEQREIQALCLWSMALRSVWSHRFNDACQQTLERKLPGFFGSVMGAVHDYHPNVPKFLRAAPVHGYGLIHQEVEVGQAGWVRDWHKIAEAHRRVSEGNSESVSEDRDAQDRPGGESE